MEHSFIKNVPSLYATLFNKKKQKQKKFGSSKRILHF